MNESYELDPNDPLLAQLSAMRPAGLSGFESQVMYSAGRADAIREFAVRGKRQVWLSAAAMLLIAIGSSALTWNFSVRLPGSDIASTEKSDNALAVVIEQTDAPKHEAPVAVAQNDRVPAATKSVNQLVDELLKLRGHSIWTTPESTIESSAEPWTQPISTGPKTWLQLQRELLKESSTF